MREDTLFFFFYIYLSIILKSPNLVRVMMNKRQRDRWKKTQIPKSFQKIFWKIRLRVRVARQSHTNWGKILDALLNKIVPSTCPQISFHHQTSSELWWIKDRWTDGKKLKFQKVFKKFSEKLGSGSMWQDCLTLTELKLSYKERHAFFKKLA